MEKPIIGVTLDREETGEYASVPWYALRENYFEALTAKGAITIGLPHDADAIAHYADMIDGLVITGGFFDVSPELYGMEEKHDSVILKEKRTKFEWGITEAILEQKKPILGICAGEQLLNVIAGGTLIQHIPDEVDNALEHEQKIAKTEPSHSVAIAEGSLLAKITGQSKFDVNSTHHQAVKDVAPDFIASAVAPDGVIEAIEHKDHPFCLGIQWHPEFAVNDYDHLIFEEFVNASSS